MSLRQRADEAQQRALLFGRHQRRGGTHGGGTGVGVASVSEQESMEAANDASVDGLRGRVGEMRHVSEASLLSWRGEGARGVGAIK